MKVSRHTLTSRTFPHGSNVNSQVAAMVLDLSKHAARREAAAMGTEALSDEDEPGMHLLVDVMQDERVLTRMRVAVGQGDQTVQWLGLTVAQRMVVDGKSWWFGNGHRKQML